MDDSSSLVGQPAHVTQYIATLCAALGSLNMGLTLGYASPSTPMLGNSSEAVCPLPHDEPLDDLQLSVYSSIVNVGAMLGVIIGGLCVNYIGRRGTMILCIAPFALGWGLIG